MKAHRNSCAPRVQTLPISCVLFGGCYFAARGEWKSLSRRRAGKKWIFMAPARQAALTSWRGGCSFHQVPTRGFLATGQKWTSANSVGRTREGEERQWEMLALKESI